MDVVEQQMQAIRADADRAALDQLEQAVKATGRVNAGHERLVATMLAADVTSLVDRDTGRPAGLQVNDGRSVEDLVKARLAQPDFDPYLTGAARFEGTLARSIAAQATKGDPHAPGLRGEFLARK